MHKFLNLLYRAYKPINAIAEIMPNRTPRKYKLSLMNKTTNVILPP